jgi:hypothetical protein
VKRGTRRILFWLAVAIFGAASIIAGLTAQGYKYDFGRNRFVRTGAVAVTANTDARLYVGGEEAAAMSFLNHRTGLDRLLPGSYAIRVVKDGYFTWHKTASIQEGLLTDFPLVLLIPMDQASSSSVHEEIAQALAKSVTVPKKAKEVSSGQFTLRGTALYRSVNDQEALVASGVIGFMLIDDDHRVMWWTRNEVWVLWLTNTDYQPFRTAGQEQMITRFASPIIRAAWFHDADHIVVDLGDSYRIFETDTRGGINIFSI